MLLLSFPKSIWFLALCRHSGPKYLYLAMKTSYLYVYLVPTWLSIFRKKSYLHVYLVYTFIQYHVVFYYMSLFNKINWSLTYLHTYPKIWRHVKGPFLEIFTVKRLSMTWVHLKGVKLCSIVAVNLKLQMCHHNCLELTPFFIVQVTQFHFT